MMKDTPTEQQIENTIKIFDCSREEAIIRYEMYQAGHRMGVKEGQAEAQRFFRISLGLEAPTPDERAFWNNPVPLKEETGT